MLLVELLLHEEGEGAVMFPPMVLIGRLSMGGRISRLPDNACTPPRRETQRRGERGRQGGWEEEREGLRAALGLYMSPPVGEGSVFDSL